MSVSLIPNADTMIIDESPSIRIETVRDVGIWLSSRPYASPKKVVVFVRAERLTTPAQHALLKTLEEPPTYAQIILVAQHESALLPTIVSRCVIVRAQHINSISSHHGEQHVLAFPTTYADIFTLSESMKERESALEWCASIIQTLHQTLRTHPSQEVVHHMRAVQRAIRLLKRNVNVKLAIESMCFQTK